MTSPVFLHAEEAQAFLDTNFGAFEDFSRMEDLLSTAAYYVMGEPDISEEAEKVNPTFDLHTYLSDMMDLVNDLGLGSQIFYVTFDGYLLYYAINSHEIIRLAIEIIEGRYVRPEGWDSEPEDPEEGERYPNYPGR